MKSPLDIAVAGLKEIASVKYLGVTDADIAKRLRSLAVRTLADVEAAGKMIGTDTKAE